MRGTTISDGYVRVDFGVTGGGEDTVLPTSPEKVASLHVSRDMELEEVLVGLTTATSSGIAIFDVQLNDDSSPGGTSIFSTRPQIDINSLFSGDSATQAVISTPTLTKGDQLSFYCDQADAGGSGAGLKFYVAGNVDTNSRLLDYSISASDETTDLTASSVTPLATFHAPRDFTLEDIYAGVTTAPAGADLQVDVKLYNDDSPTGLSVFTTVPQIDDGTTFSGDSNSPINGTLDLSQITINKGDKFELYCTQVGSTTAGAGLKFYINAKY
jgi:hypothetical protein